MATKLAIFKGKEIRRTLYNDEWWFSVVDVCAVLTDSRDAGAYWRKLKQRLKADGSEPVTICHGLKVIAPDGKNVGQIVLIPKVFLESFNPFLPLKPSLSNAGWQRSDMNGCRKLKIRTCHQAHQGALPG